MTLIASPSEPPPPTSDATELEKLRLEVEKLRAETRSISKPLRHPTVVGALVVASMTTLASIANLVAQVRFSKREYQLAQIRTERLELEARSLETRKSELDSTILALQKGVRTLELLAQDKMSQLRMRLTPCPPEMAGRCNFEFVRVPCPPDTPGDCGFQPSISGMVIEPKEAPNPALQRTR